jgi:hypothetical protein
MPLAGFEPTIPVLKRAKTFHALERAATVTGLFSHLRLCNSNDLFPSGFRIKSLCPFHISPKRTTRPIIASPLI